LLISSVNIVLLLLLLLYLSRTKACISSGFSHITWQYQWPRHALCLPRYFTSVHFTKKYCLSFLWLLHMTDLFLIFPTTYISAWGLILIIGTQIRFSLIAIFILGSNAVLRAVVLQYTCVLILSLEFTVCLVISW